MIRRRLEELPPLEISIASARVHAYMLLDISATPTQDQSIVLMMPRVMRADRARCASHASLKARVSDSPYHHDMS
jgi:hypothetical protein